MTLQIAWSGVIATEQHPANVPRFPTLSQERFMAYQAIVNGARGLAFFGGHLTQIARPADAKAGWNWTFWERVLRPLLEELTSDSVAPALVAPDARSRVKASAKDVELVTREADGFLYVIAVRRGSATSRVGFSGLPARLTGGEVLFEYDDQAFRTVERRQRPLPRLVRAARRTRLPLPAVALRQASWRPAGSSPLPWQLAIRASRV